MAQYTIDNNRSTNKNSRDNFSRGEKNTFVYSSSEFERTYLRPNRIQYKYSKYLSGDDRYWLNSDSLVDKTQYSKRQRTYTEYLFGIRVPERHSNTIAPYLRG